jgi:hypothetical protein
MNTRTAAALKILKKECHEIQTSFLGVDPDRYRIAVHPEKFRDHPFFLVHVLEALAVNPVFLGNCHSSGKGPCKIHPPGFRAGPDIHCH